MPAKLTLETFHYTEISSTNDEAKRKIRENEIETPFFITADHQSQGRGTKGRQWYSEPNKQLLYTLAYPTRVHEIDPAPLVLKSADIVVQQVKDTYGVNLDKEWPNDLILNNRKCGGILLELTKHGDFMWLVFGLGLNINTKFFPKYLNYSATSFALESDKDYDRQVIVQPLTDALMTFLADI